MADKKNEADTAFTFSFARALETKKDIKLQLEAAEARIERFVTEVRLDGHPIIGAILSVSHDPDDLRKVAAALERVADIIPAIDELQGQVTMIELASKNPDKFKGMFGSFDDEIDSFLSTLKTTEG